MTLYDIGCKAQDYALADVFFLPYPRERLPAVGTFPHQMGSLGRFKYQRPLSYVANYGEYVRYNRSRMRQLASQGLVAIDGPGAQALVRINVPAGSWAQNKSLFYRFAWRFTGGPGPMPVGYAVAEQWQGVQLIATTLPGPGAMVNGLPSASNIEECRIVRVGAGLYGCNIGDNMVRSYINDANAINYVQQIPPFGGTYDFSQVITVEHAVMMAGTWPGSTIDIIWQEAFLEQGTNLGTLA